MQIQKKQKNTPTRIYESFIKGSITKKNAVDGILVYIFKNREYYSLGRMDEDNFNDFLLYIIPLIGNCLEKYSNDNCSFSTFLQSVVRRTKLNFERKLYIKATDQKYFQHIAELDLHSRLEKEDSKDSDLPEKQIIHKKFTNTQLLIMALKCSYFLDDEKIKKIATKTGYNERYIWSLKNKIDKEMSNRYEKNKERIESLNRFFYLKHKASIYASLKTKEDSVYERAIYLEKFHTNRWKKKSQQINYRFVVPTNRFLAKILGLEESFVSNAISKTKKHAKKIES